MPLFTSFLCVCFGTLESNPMSLEAQVAYETAEPTAVTSVLFNEHLCRIIMEFVPRNFDPTNSEELNSLLDNFFN